MFRYLVVSISTYKDDVDITENKLNQLGQSNWELIAVSDGLAFFKRPIK